jgi:putative hydrolase of the HAD superfamily
MRLKVGKRPEGRLVKMAIKALMVDVDGVVVVHPHPHGWAATLEQDLGLARETLQAAFFKPHFHDVVHGRAALRDRLSIVLQEIAPHLTCDLLIDYWFANDAHLDHDLLAQLGDVRRRGWRAALWTGEHKLEALLTEAAPPQQI